MEELVNQTGDSAQEPKRNAGWFRQGDRRINREGRPRGSKVASPGEDVYCASCADRVMLLHVPARVLAHRLLYREGPWLNNLPRDVKVVGCRIDSTGKVVLTVNSAEFPRIAKGAVIPTFRPEPYGQRWCRWE